MKGYSLNYYHYSISEFSSWKVTTEVKKWHFHGGMWQRIKIWQEHVRARSGTWQLLGDSRTFGGKWEMIMPQCCICNGSSRGFPGQGSQPLHVWSHVSSVGWMASFQTTSPNTSQAPISGPLSMLLQQPIACSTSCLPAELIYFLRLNSIAILGRSFLNPFKFWCALPHITPISPMILQQNHSLLRLLSFPRTKARGLKPSTLPAQVQILKPSDEKAAGEERKGWGKNGLEKKPGFFSLSSWRPVPMSEPFAFRVRK